MPASLKPKHIEDLLRKIEDAKSKNKSLEVREQFESEIRKIDEDKRMIEIVFTSEAVDRHHTVLLQKGMQLKAFRKNPQFLKNHENKIESALGTIKNIRKDDKDPTRSIADFYFDFDTPFGETAFKLYKNGTLRAVSVGFIPLAWEWKKIAEKDKYETLHFTKWELTEVSAVAVGSNREALKKSLEGGDLTEEDLDRFANSIETREIDPEDTIEDPNVGGDPNEDEERSVEELRADLEKQLRVFTENHNTMKAYRSLLKELKKKFDYSGTENEEETIRHIIELAKTNLSDYDTTDRSNASPEEIPQTETNVEHKMSPEDTLSLAKQVLS